MMGKHHGTLPSNIQVETTCYARPTASGGHDEMDSSWRDFRKDGNGAALANGSALAPRLRERAKEPTAGLKFRPVKSCVAPISRSS
jgi:hypothetical protein